MEEARSYYGGIAMAKKPTPKELVVDVTSAGRIIILTCSTEDARWWIGQEAPQFGALIPPLPPIDSYMLLVSVTYDMQEVAVYLRSYNDEIRDGSPED
jgi:hypothetical protein